LINKIQHKETDDLAAVQSCYENNDSIIVCPISTDYLRALRIIGKNIDVDIVLKNKNTLFFWKIRNDLWHFEKKHYICDWYLVHFFIDFGRSKDVNNL